jgi:hypothetical protein
MAAHWLISGTRPEEMWARILETEQEVVNIAMKRLRVPAPAAVAT